MVMIKVPFHVIVGDTIKIDGLVFQITRKGFVVGYTNEKVVYA